MNIQEEGNGRRQMKKVDLYDEYCLKKNIEDVFAEINKAGNEEEIDDTTRATATAAVGDLNRTFAH